MSELDRAKRLQMLRLAGAAAPLSPTQTPPPHRKRRPLGVIGVPPKYAGTHRAQANPMFMTLRR